MDYMLFYNQVDDSTIYRGCVHTKAFSLHTTPLVMLGEHFLRKRAKRLILTNHLGDIRLHKQRKSLSRHILRPRCRADPDTMRGRAQFARSGDLQCLPGLEREAGRRDGDLRERAPTRADVQAGRRGRRVDGHDAPVRVVRQVDRRTQPSQAADPVGVVSRPVSRPRGIRAHSEWSRWKPHQLSTGSSLLGRGFSSEGGK